MGMTRRPTIRTVADRAGVSVATVSYVLSGRIGGNARVAAGTRERVLAVAQELGYQANRQARSVRRGRSDQVCLVLGRLDTPWAQAIMRDVPAEVGPEGYTTVVLVGGEWSEFLRSGGADAAVIDAVGDPATATRVLEELAARGMVIVAHHAALDARGYDVLRPDELPACLEAVALLTGRHTRIACLRGSPPVDGDLGGAGGAADDRDGGREERDVRFAAYVESLAAAGLEFDPDLVRFTHTSRSRAYREVVAMLDLPVTERPTAVFATSDVAALGALDAARRQGLDVPGDLEVIGVGNTPEGGEADPPLSSVGPAESFPSDVARLLLKRLKDRATGHEVEAPSVHVVPWALHLRESTVTDPLS